MRNVTEQPVYTGCSVKVSPSGNKSRLTREFGDLQVGGQLIAETLLGLGAYAIALPHLEAGRTEAPTAIDMQTAEPVSNG